MSAETNLNPNVSDAANRLGTEPVGKLLLKFSVPAITGMIVNALYNIVDRIFVGRGVNEIALGGLSLVMPLMTLMMAFAMLFGMGAANLVSMRLGQQRREDAENALNHCFWLLLLCGVVTMAVGLVFLDPLLQFVRADPGKASYAYARDYMRVICYGAPFFLVGFGFSHCTRAQGFPNVTMIGMLIGAVMNTILDPIFIFVFHWGVEGAAWATILSQFVSFCWIVGFSASKRAVVRLKPLRVKPQWHMVTQIAAFGSAQFLLQVAASLVQSITNDSLLTYGERGLGPGGGDIALTGMNISMSLSMLFMMPVFGLNQGGQPILGYNYGAKRFDRVLQTYVRLTVSATAFCVIGFLVTQLFPEPLTRLFAPDGSPQLLEFAPVALRTVMLMLPVIGFQIVSANFFVVTGRPHLSSLLSLSRQVLVLIPCLYLFGLAWGFEGVLRAFPAADLTATLLTTVFIAVELRRLRRMSRPPKEEEAQCQPS